MHTHPTNNPKKFKRALSACQKTDGNCFRGQETVLIVEFMQQGTTVTSELYTETLKITGWAIQNKRRGMLTSGVVLLHGNERPYTVARIRALLEHFNWELFDHPSYSHDLAPTTICLPT
jgi:hypothetical protein